MNKNIITFLLIASISINLVLGWTMMKSSASGTIAQAQLSYSVSEYKGDPEADLINVINKAEKEIDIAIYNLDNKDIADAIADAAGRGVSVRIIADGENTENEDSQEILDELADQGIAIKVNTNEKMHLKLTIADDQTVVTGSFNYTKDSAEDNQEVLVAIGNTELATAMKQTYEEMWSSAELTSW